MADEPDESQAAEESPPPRPMWRRRGIVGFGVLIAGAAIFHVFSPMAAVAISGGTIAAAGGALYVRHLPRIRHHFNDGRRERRPRTPKAPGLLRRAPRGTRVPQARMPRTGLRRSGVPRSGGLFRSPGASRPRRSGGGLFRRSGGTGGRAGSPPAGRSGRRPSGAASRRGGTGTRRHGSPFRRTGTSGSPFSGTSHSGGSRGPARRGYRSGGSRGGSGRSLRHPLRRTRGGTPGGTPRGRRPGTSGGSRTGTGSRSRPGTAGRSRTGRSGRSGGRGSTAGRRSPASRYTRRTGRPGTAQGARGRRPGTGTRTGTRTRNGRKVVPGSVIGNARTPRSGRKRPGATPGNPNPGTPHSKAQGTRSRKGKPPAAKWTPEGGVQAVPQKQPSRMRAVRFAGRRFRSARTWFRYLPKRTEAAKAAAMRRAAGHETKPHYPLLLSLLFFQEWRGAARKRRAARKRPPVTYTIHPPKKPASTPGPKKATDDTRMPRPAQAPKSRRAPSRTGLRPSPSTSGAPQMSMISHVGDEIASGLNSLEFHNAADIRDVFNQLPDIFRAVQAGLGHVADKMEAETPIHPDVIEHWREMLTALSGLADHADGLGPMFEQRHEDDLKRIDDPRPNEEILDVQSNR